MTVLSPGAFCWNHHCSFDFYSTRIDVYYGPGLCTFHLINQPALSLHFPLMVDCKLSLTYPCILVVYPSLPLAETPVTLLALTIIDPATSWFVITPLLNKESQGSHFIWSMHPWQWLRVITTVKNTQANIIVEYIHQIIANMLCTSNPTMDPKATVSCNTMGNQHNLSYVSKFIAFTISLWLGH